MGTHPGTSSVPFSPSLSHWDCFDLALNRLKAPRGLAESGISHPKPSLSCTQQSPLAFPTHCRLSFLENCSSGRFGAFGSDPPHQLLSDFVNYR